MFDFSFHEFLVVAFVLFLVIPAKDFPKVMRFIVRSLQKIKNTVSGFFAQFEEPLHEFKSIQSDIEKEAAEVKKNLRRHSSLHNK